MSRGPLPVPELRRAIAAAEVEPGARFRATDAQAWLPGAAWEALADLLPATSVPAPPVGSGEESLPEEIASTPLLFREHLLWFVADGDGVMGPVSGDFVMKGLKAGKIPLAALISLATWRVDAIWVRAALVFPTSSVGSITVRKRLQPPRPCMYCMEMIAGGDAICRACGEPVRVTAPLSRAQRALAVAGAFVMTASAALAAVAFVRRPAQAPVMAAMPTDPGSPADESAARGDKAIPPDAPAWGRGHLATGEIAARLTAGRDLVDALALSEHRIALARRDTLDVIDSRSGAHVFSAPELAGVRALYPIHGASASGVASAVVGKRRLAIIDAATVRVSAWFDVAPAAPSGLPVAIDRGIALVPVPARQVVAVLDVVHQAELGRPTFEEPLRRVVVADTGRMALAVAGVETPPKPQRALAAPAEGVVYAFSPAGAAAERAIAGTAALGEPPSSSFERAGGASASVRRLDLGEPPAAIAVASDGAFGVAALDRGELVRIDLSPTSALVPPGPRAKTCAEPGDVAIAGGVIVVACRGGNVALLHDGDTLTVLAWIDLGGPAIGLDLAPDRAQALVTVGAPAHAVVMIDLRGREARTIAAGEPISAARYGLGGRVATAFALESHRVLVLR